MLYDIYQNAWPKTYYELQKYSFYVEFPEHQETFIL